MAKDLRILVTAEYLARSLTAGHPIEALCFVPDDGVREVLVPVNGTLPPWARWLVALSLRRATAGGRVGASRARTSGLRGSA